MPNNNSSTRSENTFETFKQMFFQDQEITNLTPEEIMSGSFMSKQLSYDKFFAKMTPEERGEFRKDSIQYIKDTTTTVFGNKHKIVLGAAFILFLMATYFGQDIKDYNQLDGDIKDPLYLPVLAGLALRQLQNQDINIGRQVLAPTFPPSVATNLESSTQEKLVKNGIVVTLENSSEEKKKLVKDGAKFLYSGRFDEAISIFEKAVKSDPENIYYRAYLANAYAANDQLDRAEEHLQKVLKTNPADPNCNYLLGRLNYQNEKYEESAVNFRVAMKASIFKIRNGDINDLSKISDIKLEKHDIETLILVARDGIKYIGWLIISYYKNRQYQEATDLFKKISWTDFPHLNIEELNVDKNADNIHLLLGHAFYENRMFAEAQKQYGEAIRAYYKAGEYRKALEVFDVVVNMKEYDANVDGDALYYLVISIKALKFLYATENKDVAALGIISLLSFYNNYKNYRSSKLILNLTKSLAREYLKTNPNLNQISDKELEEVLNLVRTNNRPANLTPIQQNVLEELKFIGPIVAILRRPKLSQKIARLGQKELVDMISLYRASTDNQAIDFSSQNQEFFSTLLPSGIGHIHLLAITKNLPILKSILEEKKANLHLLDLEGKTALEEAIFCFDGSEDGASVVGYLFSRHLSKLYLSKKIEFVQKLIANNSLFEHKNAQFLLKIFKEEFVKSVIPADIAKSLHGNFFPEDFLTTREGADSVSSPCDVFSVTSAIKGEKPFQGSSLPSQKLKGKAVILAENSFGKGKNAMSLAQKKQLVQFLIENGFSVYLPTQQSSSEIEVKRLNDCFENGVATKDLEKFLNSQEIPNYEKNREAIFQRLTKFDPSISADNSINPNLQQLFLVLSLSYLRGFQEDDQKSKKIDILNKKEDFEIIRKMLEIENTKSFFPAFDYENKASYLLGILALEVVFSRLYSAIPSETLISKETADAVSVSASYVVEQAANAAFNLAVASRVVQQNNSDLAPDINSSDEAFNLNTTTQNLDLGAFGDNPLSDLEVGSPKPHKKQSLKIASNTGDGFSVTDQNSDITYQMESIGEILNPPSVESVDIITRLQKVRIADNNIEVYSAELPENCHTLKPKLLRAKQQSDGSSILSYQTTMGNYEEVDLGEDLYTKLSIRLKAGERKRIFSIDPNSDELVGTFGSSNVEITQDDNGFFYALSTQDTTLSYVLRSSLDHSLNLGSSKDEQEQKIAAIIADYKDETKGFVRSIDQSVELPKMDERGAKNWLERMYEFRKGSCNQRCLAVYHRIVTQYPEYAENGRLFIKDVNADHSVLAIKSQDNGKWITYDLGGSVARHEHSPEKEPEYLVAQKEELFSTNLRTPLPLTQPPFDQEQQERQEQQEQKEEEEEFQILLNTVFTIGLSTALSAKTIKEELEILENELAEFVEKLAKEFGDGATPIRQRTTKLLENFKKAVANKQLLNGIKLATTKALDDKLNFKQTSDVEEVFTAIQQRRGVLLMGENVENTANALIKKFNIPGKSVFYLNSPEQIFEERNLEIGADGKVKIINESLFAKFIKNLPEGAELIIIIDWTKFNKKQILALNAMLDDDSRVGSVRIPNPRIVSLVGGELPNDPSFISRHNQIVNFTVAPSLVPASPSGNLEDQAIAIDLEGMSDPRQKLFGFIKLNGNKIEWEKSEFCHHLQNGKGKFILKNISKKYREIFIAELNEARARGYFDYYGYRIEFSADLTINFDQKEFDFSKFKNQKLAVNVKEKVQYQPNLLPENFALVNNFLFDHLLKRNAINQENQYVEQKGIIEENANKELNLFITSQLSDQQIYCLFNQALKHNVVLNLYLAEGIVLPNQIKYNPIESKELELQAASQPKNPQIFVTQNPNEVLKTLPEQYAVISVEDEDYASLFDKITYEDNATGDGYINFRTIISEFAQKLIAGKPIVLKGAFSENLLAVLHQILCSGDPRYSNIKDNLIIIIEDSSIAPAQNKYQPLAFLPENAYQIIHCQPKVKSEQENKDYREPIENEDEIDLSNSQEKSAQFMERREKAFSEMLKNNPIVRIVGHSGVGKSQFLIRLKKQNQEYTIFNELGNFGAWAGVNDTQKNLLVIDESNTENSNLLVFEPLKTLNQSERVRLLNDGKFYEINQNHGVVLISNPNNYSSGRFEQKLVDDSIPIIHLEDFPSYYIYEEILKKPIYDNLGENVKRQINEEEFQAECKKFLKQYKEFNKQKIAEKDEAHCMSVRRLQQQVLHYIRGRMSLSNHADITNDNFISTNATVHLENSLGDFIDIRDMQEMGDIGPVSAGLRAFIIEGNPGIGKSELIKATLKSRSIIEIDPDQDLDENEEKGNLGRIGYYKITADMSASKIKNILLKAAKKGRIVHFDEINSKSSEIEKTVNALLTGESPDGDPDFKVDPRFRIIASINSAFLGGRSQLAPAIIERSEIHQAPKLRDYQTEDLQKIAKQCFLASSKELPEDFDIDQVCLAMAEAFKEKLNSEAGKALSLRDLAKIIPDVLKEIPGVAGQKKSNYTLEVEEEIVPSQQKELIMQYVEYLESDVEAKYENKTKESVIIKLQKGDDVEIERFTNFLQQDRHFKNKTEKQIRKDLCKEIGNEEAIEKIIKKLESSKKKPAINSQSQEPSSAPRELNFNSLLGRSNTTITNN